MARQVQSGVKWNTPLRQAHRLLTRDRIKDAARRLFYEMHYDSTTIDEISVAAGLTRSTLYLHYRDKSEILADIIADYTPKAKAVMAKLPGPKPSMKDLDQWIRKVERFAAHELVPLSILQELRSRNQNPAAVWSVISELLSGLGEANPIFRESSREDGDPMIRAQGLMLLQDLAFSFEVYMTDKSDARGKALLKVLAQNFYAFLSRPENT